MVPSDCKGWNIKNFKQPIVLKVLVLGAHPQSGIPQQLIEVSGLSDELNRCMVQDVVNS